MILSRKNKFIFIKGVKVGGTSVEIALASHCGTDDIITPITPIDELHRIKLGVAARNYLEDRDLETSYLEQIRTISLLELRSVSPPTSAYYNHMSLREVFKLQGTSCGDYRVICIERNPYAKVLSWANHQLAFDSYRTGGAMQSEAAALKTFLGVAIDEGRIGAPKNIDRYRHPDGKIRAGVMRYEHLLGDFRALLSSLGLPSTTSLPHAKMGLMANRLDPKDFFTRAQLDAVNRTFEEEFAAFNYEML